MRRVLLATALALALAAAVRLGLRRSSLAPAWLGGGPRNLLVVTLDTLRADRVGSYGYAAARTPRLDALAARGLRFARAATVVPLTLPAHSSLMTGTFPARHAVLDNGGYYLDQEHETLAEVLKPRGFRTGGFISAFVLDSRWGIEQGFDRYFDDFDLRQFETQAGMDAIQRPGNETVDEALRWLGAERERPFFLWVHLYDPHTPYAAPREHAASFPRTLQGAYDAEIAFTDFQLGRLVDALEADGRLGRTVIAVLGDHGEMLGEHGELSHGLLPFAAARRVPLLLAGPGVPSGRVSDCLARTADLAPTLLQDLAGLQGHESPQGLLVRAQLQADLPHQLAAPRGGDLAPAQERLVRGPRHGVVVGGAGPPDRAHLATVDRRDHREPFARGAQPLPAVRAARLAADAELGEEGGIHAGILVRRAARHTVSPGG